MMECSGKEQLICSVETGKVRFSTDVQVLDSQFNERVPADDSQFVAELGQVNVDKFVLEFLHEGLQDGASELHLQFSFLVDLLWKHDEEFRVTASQGKFEEVAVEFGMVSHPEVAPLVHHLDLGRLQVQVERVYVCLFLVERIEEVKFGVGGAEQEDARIPIDDTHRNDVLDPAVSALLRPLINLLPGQVRSIFEVGALNPSDFVLGADLLVLFAS